VSCPEGGSISIFSRAGAPATWASASSSERPHSPEFWVAVRQAQGIAGPVAADTVGALIDTYETSWPGLPRKLSDGTKEKYRYSLRVVRDAWGNLPAEQLRPSHVQALVERIGAEKPGTANNVLDALRAMCRWACGPRELLSRDPTHGVAHFDKGEGHKPWTPEQLAFADATFAGMLRRAYVLARYTGQRISDIVRLGWTDIDDGGFGLAKKDGVRPCADLPGTLPKWRPGEAPGPFCARGGSLSPQPTVEDARQGPRAHPELDGVVWHGLRANAVIRLRQSGRSAMEISDAIGMSVPMVERYSRYADRKAGGKALLLSLAEHKRDKAVKR